MFLAPKGKRCQPEKPPNRNERLPAGNPGSLIAGKLMPRHLTPRAVNRVRWFDELSAAIDQGELVLAELVEARISPGETEALRQRLVLLRAELARLNRISLTEERVVGKIWPDGASDPLR